MNSSGLNQFNNSLNNGYYESKTKLTNKLRESNNKNVETVIKTFPKFYTTQISNSEKLNFPVAKPPKGKLFHLVPKLVHNKKSPNLLKQREPKFVPFEPYKAAVKPIMPFKNGENKIKIVNNKNNLDLNVLVSQMSIITNEQLDLSNRGRKESETSTSGMSEQESIKQKYEKQIADLKIERDYIQNQLKFQAQVNSELKNLLIASVGEDLQTKVNLLTEDKLFLARALVNTSENLSSHSEEIEYLSGQSEVWRSKFLASSLMVEELARWKASLTQKSNLCHAVIRQFLDLVSKLKEMQLEILQNLMFLSNRKDLNLKTANVMNLTSESLNIIQQLVLEHSSMGMPAVNRFEGLESLTEVEKLAISQLQQSCENLISTDEALKAIVGQAFPVILSMKQNSEQDIEKDFEIIEKQQSERK